MTSHVRPTPMTDPLYDYFLSVSLREPDLLRRLREETALLSHGDWQTAPEQGPLLDLLVKMIPAKRILELGTFTGYGTLWMALADPTAHITTCDVSDHYTAIAKRYWTEAGVGDRIDLQMGPGLVTLTKLIIDGQENSYDFAFIDADKGHYDGYYEASLALVRRGGLIVIDNTLWDGKPADEAITDVNTVAIRNLNAKLFVDPRIDLCFLPFADGLTLARKK